MALLAAIPQSPTKFDLVKNAVEEQVEHQRRGARARSSCPPNSEVIVRRNFILDLMKTRSVAHGRPVHGRPTTRPPRPSRSILASQARQVARAAVRVAGARGARPDPVRHAARRVREDQHRRLQGLTTLNYKMQRIVEKWVYAAARSSRTSRTPTRSLKDRGIPRREWRWIKGLRGHNIHNARRRRHRLPDRRGARVRGLRVVHRARATRSSSRSSTSSATAGASPGRRSSRSSTSIGIEDQHDDRGDDVHGRRDQLRAGGPRPA